MPGVIAATLLALAPPPASAQCAPGDPGLGPDPCPLDAPRWTGELAVLGGNAILGGLTAGLARRLGGGSFRDGFTRGFLGGSLVYGGKRIAAERLPGAGLAGRQVASVGGAVVANAAAGRGSLDRLALPVWIGRLYLEPNDAGGRQLTPRLDLMATFWTLYGFFEDELRFDAAGTLSAGTPVFRTDNRLISMNREHGGATGLTAAGVLYLSDIPAFGEHRRARTFAHERIHVLQMDQIFLHWTGPAERSLLGVVPGGERLARHVDVNLSTELLRLITLFFPEHMDRPWELEATYLAR